MISQMLEGFVLTVNQLMGQVKNIRNDARKNSLYLRYWWDSNSQIASTENNHPYYRVIYDNWGRFVSVETFSSGQTLDKRSVYKWQLNRVVQIDGYDKHGVLIQYQRPIYKYHSYVDKIEIYSPSGDLLETLTEHPPRD